MASEDSFIDEVTEEVRREKLFRYIRRYGWIAVAAVVLLVGGAAFNEYRKAQIRSAAEARGDAVLAALEETNESARAVAISAIEAEGDAKAILEMLAAAQAREDETAKGAALDRLAAIAGNDDVSPVYRDLAELKLVLLQGEALTPDERIARLARLSVPGAPYRPLALEATALAHVDKGETENALAILTDLLSDAQITPGLRRRASQLIVALGGELGTG